MGMQVLCCVDTELPEEAAAWTIAKVSGRSFARTSPAEREPDFGRAFNGGSCACADKHPAEVFSGARGRISEGEKRDTYCPDIHEPKEKFYG